MTKGGRRTNPGAVTLALVGGKNPDVDDDRLDDMLEEADRALPAQHVASALARNSHNPRWNLLLSWMLLRRGRADEAAKVLEKVALLDPADDSVFQTLALAIERTGDPALGREIRRHMDRWAGEQTLCTPPPGMPGDDPAWWSPTIVTAHAEYVEDPRAHPTPLSRSPSPPGPTGPRAEPLSATFEPSAAERKRSRSRPVAREGASVHDTRGPAEQMEGPRRPFEKATRVEDGGQVAREQIYPRPNVERQKRASWRTLWLTLAVAGVVVGLFRLASESVPTLLIDDDARVRELLAAGNLGELAETVPAERVDDPSSSSAPLLADAVLYRFVDADVVRRDRLERALATAQDREGGADGSGTTSRALMMPAVERFELLPDLLTLERTPLVLYLIATTLERAGEVDQAKDVWGELAAVERLPPYLAVPTASYFQRTGRGARARRLLASARKNAASDDPWRAATNSRTRSNSDLVPVVSAELGLRRALGELQRGSTQRGLREARAAARVVNGQRAVLLDFFERFMLAGHRDAAGATLDEIEKTDVPAVLAARGRLLTASGDAARGRRHLIRAWREGLRDPQVALLLVTVPPNSKKRGDKKSRDGDVEPREILEPLLNRWPGNHHIALAYAQVLVDRGASTQAIELLRDRASWIQGSAAAAERAGAYYTLARAEQSRGRRGRAIKHLEDALASDPGFDPAKKLRRALR